MFTGDLYKYVLLILGKFKDIYWLLLIICVSAVDTQRRNNVF